MTWTITPTVTVNGVSYVSNAVGAISVDYGRTSVWEPQKPGYARITLLNTDNTAFAIDLNQQVIIKIKDYAGVNDITIFTGTVTNIENSVVSYTAATTLAGVTITAVAPLSVLARTQSGLVDYPAETDNDRISRIFSECDVTVAAFDTAVYDLIARPAAANNALALANYYALMATGSLYETTTGSVGYDSQYSRNLDVSANGYFAINSTYINFQTLKSSFSIGELLNNVNLQYNGNNYITAAISASQALYGDMQATIKTELSSTEDAQNVANLYLAMRAYPHTSLTSVEINLINPDINSTTVDKMLNTYFGMPISISGAPTPIYDGTYYGFVEGWNLTFNGIAARIVLRTSEKTYSYRPLTWQDPNPTTIWTDIDPTAVKTTLTNAVLNPSIEVNTTGWIGFNANYTVSQYTTDSKFGAASMRVNMLSATGLAGAISTRNSTYRIPVANGQTWTVQAWFKNLIGTRGLRVQIATYATATGTTAVESFNGSNLTNPTTWTQSTLTATFTNASSLWMEVRLWHSSTGTAGDAFLVDGIMAVQASSNTYYWDGTNTDIPTNRNYALAWTGTANLSTSTATAYFSTIPATTWDNVDTVGLP